MAPNPNHNSGDPAARGFADREACLAAIARRDPKADGRFWYSVTTTGIFCRPSCHSKRAQPQHIQIHDTLNDARATGFRACRRCNPEGPSIIEQNDLIVAAACRRIEAAETELSLAKLADGAGLSISHFHRVFKGVTGVTPRDYAFAQRAIRVRRGLARGKTVTSVLYEAGFNSSGRFYEKSGSMLGMTPTAYRSGGVNETIRFAVGQCSLGAILVASSKRGVAAILIGDDPGLLLADLQDRFPSANLIGADHRYEQLVAHVVALVENPRRGHDLPLDVRGTAFQQRVWRALLNVPPGETVSYAELTDRIGAPKSVQDVASACAANNLAIAIPCHRVVKSNGSFLGYAWGIDRKRQLLDQERNTFDAA
ncbi:bifunctional DNA-binding transcriptional regulator/O6-methylguanine-DNA methyltransferase Ada [Sphingobium sp. HWE2-09]|uniref:bifunctional DNA-binding transcriptional regulator/O6-methylguanine-DNA methyltransferase Ada n=1 Tax=Sphingobium sp. HWE2-09 TaxID=3108390 RepID=UPI002DC5A8F0|nr:bifunctional DNA-binding transcriptional regulator/O6-methylguanine-DNA methyltransferase Ada [Sphingobium sp. HWE2-09]